MLAVLEVPELGLEVPVYASASDLDMDRGAGWIAGTARPDQVGNVGIAGHRDGYFRVLKDAEVGDALELRTAAGLERYVIDDILIVDPVDIDVLDPTDEKVLTIVTCYPFYFVGSAPQRYIIRARRSELDSGDFSTTFSFADPAKYPENNTSAL
jgi:sortase A